MNMIMGSFKNDLMPLLVEKKIYKVKKNKLTKV
jgi:hypothetical protein